MSGYFFDASNEDGLRTQPWILRPSKLLYQNSSGSLSLSSLNSWSLKVVSFFDVPVAASRRWRSPTEVCVEMSVAKRRPVWSAVNDMRSWLPDVAGATRPLSTSRSEEHTSEL